ncbi:hypothetical protein POREN0001_0678 [Porphyromonas endodontalis ATCC 35406]|uniref:Uncharacterized protein n=1 Tax=Porphyromonas endodontalis (strain ATCC 35406 / DSM 24491 / JCM 8526 / CCUG 16442 / BCRC 14492 / NCTC 13058 / HG 370) TaxID=553175 RepID=C3JCZ2_POREA|nr:hypothetical protein POREN0001_0678 [Porphyromonas endodontalis ATCC 35406]
MLLRKIKKHLREEQKQTSCPSRERQLAAKDRYSPTRKGEKTQKL